MSDIARALLVGRLTRDPELNASGKVLSFSVACGRRQKNGEDWEDVTSFFDVKVLGNRAQGLSTFLSKGMQVSVDARIVQERWDDKDTGKGRSAVRFLADEVVVAGKGSGTSDSTSVVSDFPAEVDPYKDTSVRDQENIPF